MRTRTLLTGSLLALSVDAAPFMVGREPTHYDEDGWIPMKRNSTTFPDWAKTCEEQGRTTKNWKDLRMDYWVHTMSDSIFDGKAGSFKGSYPEGIMAQIPGFPGFDCSFDEGCQFDYDDTGGISCSSGGSVADADFNAFYMFILYGVSNFYAYMKAMYNAFSEVANDVIGGYDDDLVNTFTTHLTSSSNSDATSALIIAGAILGGLAALIGGVGEAGLAAATGALGATTGIATGVLIGSTSASVDTAIIENNRTGTLKAQMTNATSAFEGSISKYAHTILQQPVDTSDIGYSYSDHSNSGPWVLKNGTFAQPAPDGLFDKYKSSAKAAMVSGAISWLWTTESVFVVSVSQEINGKMPCDLDTTDDYDLKNRVCDGDMAYFFIKNAGIDNPWEPYGQAPGFDKLSTWGLNGVDVAKASIASQDTGGYLKDWSLKETLPFLQGSKAPPKALLFNLPVCSLDYMKDSWPSGNPTSNNDDGEPTDATYVRWIIDAVCWSQTVNDQDFPYDHLSGPNEVTGCQGGGSPCF